MADWTEEDIVADLATIYKVIDPTPSIRQVEDAKGVTWLQLNVLEVGASEKDQKPVGYQKNIDYYVYHRDQTDESAYYFLNEPLNSAQKAISTDSTSLYTYTTIYSSQELRTRVTGAVLKAAVYFIGVGTVNKDFHWSQDVIKDPAKYLNAFMCECANNDTVRTMGNTISDADLDYIVNVNISIVEDAYGFVS